MLSRITIRAHLEDTEKAYHRLESGNNYASYWGTVTRIVPPSDTATKQYMVMFDSCECFFHADEVVFEPQPAYFEKVTKGIVIGGK